MRAIIKAISMFAFQPKVAIQAYIDHEELMNQMRALAPRIDPKIMDKHAKIEAKKRNLISQQTPGPNVTINDVLSEWHMLIAAGESLPFEKTTRNK